MCNVSACFLVQSKNHHQIPNFTDRSFLCRSETEKTSEMFDNPLYGSMDKLQCRSKDQDHQQKDYLSLPDSQFPCSKAAEGDPDRPPVPTPRSRSYTCSENKPHPPAPISLHPPSQKKPVVPSRSEGGVALNRPPLPAKSRPGMPEPQAPKSRDYRENSELPSKHRPPTRHGQPQPHKDGKEHWRQMLFNTHIHDITKHMIMQALSSFNASRSSQDGPSCQVTWDSTTVQLPAQPWIPGNISPHFKSPFLSSYCAELSSIFYLTRRSHSYLSKRIKSLLPTFSY